MPSNTTAHVSLPLALPALRGRFGDWTYYSTVIPVPELAERVSFGN
ncbi:MAG: hypothetical protein Q8N06_06485 [Hydrogenophaga sp.]|nr:hypothetical protein [Hydrogenophaga sp.]